MTELFALLVAAVVTVAVVAPLFHGPANAFPETTDTNRERASLELELLGELQHI
ncbi:hypothetical protein [Yoonia sp. SDW83-1]|uniref:hypothetical protein n=1 Tax=Yoonia sp. SDW83-1 TaxID=3366945 RepID=UPI00398C330C